MRTLPSETRQAQRTHQHYEESFVGDGAKTEFFLARRILRLEDLEVYVGGAIKTRSDRGTANDYSVRGLTPGYAGDQNAITFAAAPGNTVKVLVRYVAV